LHFIPDMYDEPQYWSIKITPLLYITRVIQKMLSQSAKAHHNNNYISRHLITKYLTNSISFKPPTSALSLQLRIA
jgi:hypothetical protein